MTKSNRERLADAYRLWHETKAGAFQQWLDLVDDDFQVGSLAEGAAEVRFSAPRRGKAEFAKYLDDLTREWTMIHYTIDDLIEQGDKIVAIVTTAWRNKKTGKLCEMPKADLWTFKNGKAVSIYEYYDTAKLIAAAS